MNIAMAVGKNLSKCVGLYSVLMKKNNFYSADSDLITIPQYKAGFLAHFAFSHLTATHPLDLCWTVRSHAEQSSFCPKLTLGVVCSLGYMSSSFMTFLTIGNCVFYFSRDLYPMTSWPKLVFVHWFIILCLSSFSL